MQKKILIIEDSKDLAEVLSMRLQYEGFDVISAFDGAEGFRKAQTEKPDLVILDLLLPKMDGREAIMELKLDEKTRDLPIIALTGIAEEFNKAFTLQLGARDYIQKPFDSKYLVQRIRDILKI